MQTFLSDTYHGKDMRTCPERAKMGFQSKYSGDTDARHLANKSLINFWLKLHNMLLDCVISFSRKKVSFTLLIYHIVKLVYTKYAAIVQDFTLQRYGFPVNSLIY